MFTVSQANPQMPALQSDNQQVQPLNNEHKAEVLSFLAARPLHAFMATSWIADNGMVSPFNRGTFYGYRDSEGELEGVALIGHITLIETRTPAALATFATLAQRCPSVFAVLGEEKKISEFASHYRKGGTQPRRVCRELLLEKRTQERLNTIESLRQARLDELDLVAPAHAMSAFEESGVNPLEVDADGFRERCARRIKQGRVWVAIESGRLKFKADVVSHTPEVIYVEGAYVSSEHRGNGYGARCMTQLTNHLLNSTKSVCLLVNEKNLAAQASYRKAGYQLREHFDTLYLQHPSQSLN